ncbi:MAG: hypothetical protein IPK83_21710 [Planctomycetes bacterium]|nr:hypothetical protein [Planctomycetota bacterium]
MKTKKQFDCVEMKHRAQQKIRKDLEGATHAEEIAYFRRGGEELERRIQEAKAKLRKA